MEPRITVPGEPDASLGNDRELVRQSISIPPQKLTEVSHLIHRSSVLQPQQDNSSMRCAFPEDLLIEILVVCHQDPALAVRLANERVVRCAARLLEDGAYLVSFLSQSTSDCGTDALVDQQSYLPRLCG